MDSAEAEALVAKSGENCIQVFLKRSTEGLAVKVWAQPKVEDFIRSLGTGEHLDVNTLGRHWKPAIRKEPEIKLMVYEMSRSVGSINLDDHGFSFNLDHPGWPLVSESSVPAPAPAGGLWDPEEIPAIRTRVYSTNKKLPRGEVLNMGFLRLVGISEADGVRFNVNGVYTREGINSLAMRIEQAGSRFYREFLKPYQVIVTVSTMPIPEGF